MNGKKWYGACVDGKKVSGFAKNGEVFYKQPNCVLIKYTDTDNIEQTVEKDTAVDLRPFIKNTPMKACKLISVGEMILYEPSGGLISFLFKNQNNLSSVDLSEFDISSAIGTEYMFQYCTNLTNVDLSNFKTSNVTNMTAMFYGCSSLQTIDISNFDTSKVKFIGTMFYGCSSLMDLSLCDFNISNLTYYGEMFTGIPSNCLIKVKSQTMKDWVLSVRSDLTNVIVTS